MENASPPNVSPEHIAARRILAVTEEELQRIVLDIHDGPVQQLFAAQAQMSLMQKRRARGEAVAPAEYDRLLARLVVLVEGALAEIRNFLGAFRPPDFSHRGMAEIIRGLLMNHEMATGCEVDFVAAERPLPASLPVKIALYRICQEALSNAYRHANCQRPQVWLDVEGNEIVLEVRDDGQGFEPPPLDGPQATEREEHIGLRGMRDRIVLVGGTMTLDSAPGQGTRIRVKAPLDE